MKKSNILILSAGRRVELVSAFKRDLAMYYPDGQVFCADMNPDLSSACKAAHQAFKVPPALAVDYLDCVKKICLENSVGLVIPTIDTELLLLSENRLIFEKENIHVIISDQELIALCRDKRKTATLFNALSIDYPKIFSKESITFPCFCKPYDGSRSVGAMVIKQKSDLTDECLNNPKNMFMELIPNTFCEYTVDAYYSQNGDLKSLVPRKRLEVRDGEVSKGVTRKNFVYDILLKKLDHLHGARGCITFQFFVNEEQKIIKGLEVNPRFGGGYPLTDSAEATFAKWLIEEYLLEREPQFFDNWESDLLMLRYDAKVLSHGYR